MSLWKEKLEIQRRIEKLISEKYPDTYFYVRNLICIENKDDDYYKTLEIFKYLYQLGGDAHIYLWNEMWLYFNDPQEIDENDYSKEELEFIKNISSFYSKECEKYGESYNDNTNINAQLVSSRLILKPYDEELNNKYKDFFSNNHSEYENFYNKEFDDYELKRYCNQRNRPLAFAIINKETNEYVGSVALTIMRADCVYNIEYYIFPEYRGNGYAFEASKRIIDAAKNKELKILEPTIREGVYFAKDANVKCIEALINVDNTKSLSLIKKFGFTLTGKQPFFEKIRDTYIDVDQYDLMI